ncbi:hypothetical protein Tco_0030950 [Tanacetum coccineum]
MSQSCSSNRLQTFFPRTRSFFYIQNTIVLAEYPALVDEANMGDRKSFKDPLPYTIRRDPLYHLLARYPIYIKNFVVAGNDKAMSFVVKSKNEKASELAPLQSSSTTTMMLMQILVVDLSGIGDRVHNYKGQKVTMLHAKLSKGKASALETLEVFDDENDLHGLLSTKELPDAMACHIMVRDMIRVYKETKKELGVAVAREAELKGKYDGAVVGLDENLIVVSLREELKSLKGQLKEHEADYGRFLLEERKWSGMLKHDRAEVVSKLVPYIAMELYHSDEVGQIVGNLLKAAIFHGRCNALEEMAATKKPVDLSKVECYRPSVEEEYNEAGSAYVTTDLKPPTITKKPSPAKPQSSALATSIKKLVSPTLTSEKPAIAELRSDPPIQD